MADAVRMLNEYLLGICAGCGSCDARGNGGTAATMSSIQRYAAKMGRAGHRVRIRIVVKDESDRNIINFYEL